jgi:hypothetical protein
MERKLVNHNGTVITFYWVEKWGNYLMRSDYKDGRMHLMFISDVEKETEILMAEGYIEAKE